MDCAIFGDDPSEFFLTFVRQLPYKNGLGSTEIANLSSFPNLKLFNLVICFLLLIKRLAR